MKLQAPMTHHFRFPCHLLKTLLTDWFVFHSSLLRRGVVQQPFQHTALVHVLNSLTTCVLCVQNVFLRRLSKDGARNEQSSHYDSRHAFHRFFSIPCASRSPVRCALGH